MEPRDCASIQHETPLPAAANLWVILLAAGDGTRVRDLTRDDDGVSAPKQFCKLDGCRSLLGSALERASGLVPMGRIVPIVAAQHRHWWEKDLAEIPTENVVIQPRNRGTAAGILLPLLSVLRRDPLARVLLLPSDHYVRDEGRLRHAIVQALHAVHTDGSRTVLVGIPPRECDTEYGWILPTTPTSEVSRVDAFVEKPESETARSLMRRGAVLNSLIIVAEGAALLQHYLRTVPRLVGEFVAWREDTNESMQELGALYQDLPTGDFSRDVLERSAEYLSVVRTLNCGWSDLGTPMRLKRHRDESPEVFVGRAVMPGSLLT